MTFVQEGTGRIVMWTSMGIRNSYTMEVSNEVYVYGSHTVSCYINNTHTSAVLHCTQMYCKYGSITSVTHIWSICNHSQSLNK